MGGSIGWREMEMRDESEIRRGQCIDIEFKAPSPGFEIPPERGFARVRVINQVVEVVEVRRSMVDEDRRRSNLYTRISRRAHLVQAKANATVLDHDV